MTYRILHTITPPAYRLLFWCGGTVSGSRTARFSAVAL